MRKCSAEYKGTQLQSSALPSMHFLWCDGVFHLRDRSGQKTQNNINHDAYGTAKKQIVESAFDLTILQRSLCWSSQAIRNISSCYQMEGMSLVVLSVFIYQSLAEPKSLFCKITTSVEWYVGHFNSAQLLRINKTYIHWVT